MPKGVKLHYLRPDELPPNDYTIVEKNGILGYKHQPKNIEYSYVYFTCEDGTLQSNVLQKENLIIRGITVKDWEHKLDIKSEIPALTLTVGCNTYNWLTEELYAMDMGSEESSIYIIRNLRIFASELCILNIESPVKELTIYCTHWRNEE